MATHWQNFMEIYLTWVKIQKKVLGRLLFLTHTVDLYTDHTHRPHTQTSTQCYLRSTGECCDVSRSLSLRSPAGNDEALSSSSARVITVATAVSWWGRLGMCPVEIHASYVNSPTALGHFLWGSRARRSGWLVRNEVRSLSGTVTWPRMSRSFFSVMRNVKGDVASSTSLTTTAADDDDDELWHTAISTLHSQHANDPDDTLSQWC